MSRPTVGALGVLILVSLVLCAVATFTDNWIVYSSDWFTNLKNVGIVPYYSANPGWFNAASWLMFISFGLFFPLILVYLHASYKVHHHGCCHDIRHNFNGISLLCSLIVIMEAVAFILFAFNANYYTPVLSENIGSSAYLALSSAIVLTIASALSGHVSRHHCH